VQPWIRAARPLALGNLLPALALGVAAAHGGGTISYSDGPIAPWLAFCAAFALLDLLTIVWANEVADREADALGHRTWVSGGSGVLVDGSITPRALSTAAAIAAGGLVVLCLAVAGSRPWMPAFALIALLLLWAYSYPPLRVSYRSGGATLQAIGVGAVLPAVGCYAVSNDLASLHPILVIASVVLAAASHVCTALPDLEGDARAGKRTLAVRLGERQARLLVTGLLVASALTSPWVTGHVVSGGLGIAVGGAALAAETLILDRWRFVLASLAVVNALTLLWICGLW
jgi:1,4-dihydroxy-2-naphthoate octaprenyltransferase